MNADKSPVVLVTGATTGIGLALVKRLQKRGFRVVATAREPSLGRFGSNGFETNERTMIRALDVTDFDQQAQVVGEIVDKWGCVDVLINNAGVSFCAVTEEMSSDAQQDQFAINYFGPLNLIRLVLPRMREKRSGHIINVSSVSGMMAMPTIGAYSASKFALEGATESLWYEMRPWRICVSLIQPGFVRSNSFLNTRLTERSEASAHNPDSPYYHYYQNMSPFIAKMMARSRSTADSVAKTIIRTMDQRSPKLRVPATMDAWLFYYLRRALPRRLYQYILYRSLPGIGSWVD